MADLQRLFFDEKSRVTDRELHVTARLNAVVRQFAGQVLTDDVTERINAAIAAEMDSLIAEGKLRERPDWLAVLVKRRLHVAFGAKAVRQLCQELREQGAV